MNMERQSEEESRPPPTTTFNILFVCTGNTCRSPLAAVLARRALELRGWQHVQIASAGAAAEEGSGASAHAITVAERAGLDLSSHRSRLLSAELAEWADLILVMSPSHGWAVDHVGGGEKVALLGDFAAGAEGAGRSVPDPFGGDEKDYALTMRELERLIEAALDRLAPILHP